MKQRKDLFSFTTRHHWRPFLPSSENANRKRWNQQHQTTVTPAPQRYMMKRLLLCLLLLTLHSCTSQTRFLQNWSQSQDWGLKSVANGDFYLVFLTRFWFDSLRWSQQGECLSEQTLWSSDTEWEEISILYSELDLDLIHWARVAIYLSKHLCGALTQSKLTLLKLAFSLSLSPGALSLYFSRFGQNRLARPFRSRSHYKCLGFLPLSVSGSSSGVCTFLDLVKTSSPDQSGAQITLQACKERAHWSQTPQQYEQICTTIVNILLSFFVIQCFNVFLYVHTKIHERIGGFQIPMKTYSPSQLQT